MNGPSAPDTAPPAAEQEQRSFTVLPDQAGQRLDRFLAECLRGDGISREKAKKLIKEQAVAIDGLPADSPKSTLWAGAVVTVRITPPATGLTPEQGDLAIVYQDACLAVINKPAGLTVHPAPGQPDGTLAHRLLAHFPALAAQEGFRPGIVHRLDKDTSGLMLAALTDAARLALSAQFARHDVFKEYLTLVHGVPEKAEGLIEAPIGRHPTHKTKMAVTPHGKSAKSAWRTLYADPRGRFALLAVRIFSGRTHQVRVHMQHLGHPLWGDAVYGPKHAKGRPADIARQMLHAWRLAFTHPFPDQCAAHPPATASAGGMTFLCPPPRDFSDALRALMRRCLRVIVTGSPGCGKSALLRLLQEAGIAVFSADAEVARLYAPGGDGQRLLRAHFGERFVPGADAGVDKAALGKAMQETPALRREVEAIIHPLVRHGMAAFWTEQEERGAPLAVAEVPLYLESGWAHGQAPSEKAAAAPVVLLGVHCPYPLREQRLLRQRGWTPEQIAATESWQWPEEKKMAACDTVIDNSGTLEELAHNARPLIAGLYATAEDIRERELQAVEALWLPQADSPAAK